MMDKVQKIRAFLVGIADTDGISTILAKAIENKILPYIDSLQEEPVSEELEKAADSYIKTHGEILGFGKQTFKAGAKWQARQSYKECLVDIKPDFAKSIIAAKKLLENPELRNLTEEEINELENGSTKLSNMSKAEEFITARTRNDINTELGWRDNGESTLLVYPWLTLDDARKAVEIAREEMIERTLNFLKDKLYKNGYIGIIDLCDEYIKTMRNE